MRRAAASEEGSIELVRGDAITFGVVELTESEISRKSVREEDRVARRPLYRAGGRIGSFGRRPGLQRSSVIATCCDAAQTLYSTSARDL
jgi:hypothetical protein